MKKQDFLTIINILSTSIVFCYVFVAFKEKDKVSNSLEYLSPPSVLERGSITVKSVKDSATSEDNCKQMIRIWGLNVYGAWKEHHVLVDNIALSFLEIYRRSINLNQTN
ncbi:hypothetical protein [Sphingobacterium haloxyli]|nr:hypothetical protein [Sphingobacterium haloxyli]